jgi:hypothetical protein
MTGTWFCILVWLLLNGFAVAALVTHHAREQRFARHADQAIDLTGGAR